MKVLPQMRQVKTLPFFLGGCLSGFGFSISGEGGIISGGFSGRGFLYGKSGSVILHQKMMVVFFS